MKDNMYYTVHLATKFEYYSINQHISEFVDSLPPKQTKLHVSLNPQSSTKAD